MLTELIAILTIGLVRGWGEVAPAWIPLIGGRRVRPMAVWGPITIALVIAYYRRRTARSPNTAVCHGTSPTADPPAAQRPPRAEGAPRS
ncbi:hypothetical protein [Streptomyces rubiginosohelvolus]|uniref:hypothetical protein n=1 Tax=Streptomyces rubiginosohelvolus TaxID=67362 RepID=UPI003F4C60A2